MTTSVHWALTCALKTAWTHMDPIPALVAQVSLLVLMDKHARMMTNVLWVLTHVNRYAATRMGITHAAATLGTPSTATEIRVMTTTNAVQMLPMAASKSASTHRVPTRASATLDLG